MDIFSFIESLVFLVCIAFVIKYVMAEYFRLKYIVKLEKQKLELEIQELKEK